MTLIEKVSIIIDKVFGGEHHCKKVSKYDDHIEIRTFETNLSTYDFSQLTFLVILAHDLCVRITIRPSKSNLSILFHDRERIETVEKGHPTIENAIKKLRETAPQYKVVE